MQANSLTVLIGVVRFIFGTLQIIGATASLIFLLKTGPSVLTVTSIALTGLVWIASRIAFHTRWGFKNETIPRR